MAKRTLLEMTQHILSAMDSDEVASIADTIEAQQIAKIIEDTYYDIVDEHDLANTKDLFALEGLADVTRPSHMKLPDDVSKIEWVKYDRRVAADDPKSYQEIIYKPPKEFVEFVMMRDTTDTANYLEVPYKANINLIIYNDSPPTYYTSFDDEYIVFDSWNNDIEDSLHAAKTLCYGTMRPSFTSESDAFIPDLPENLFPLLYNESLSRATNLWRQTVFPKVEQSASRMRVRAQRNKWRETMTHQGVDYGRRPY